MALPPLNPRPEHIKKEWFAIVARLQGMRGQHPRASAIYKINVLVDSNGLPLIFTKPRVINLEPGSVDALGRLRKVLDDHDIADREILETEILEALAM